MIKRDKQDFLRCKDYRDIFFFTESTNITTVSNKDELPRMINSLLNR